MQSLFRRRKGNDPNSHENSDSDNSNSLTTTGKRRPANVTTFRVKIPPNIRPGEIFHAYAGNRLVKLRCPPNASPGQSLAITVPKEDENVKNKQNNLHSSNVSPIKDSDPPAFMVTIPPHVRGGQKFPVKINGVDLMVGCPQNALPGMAVRIVPPTIKSRQKTLQKKGQLFEVVVPKSVKPGTSFALLANGIRISVKCPLNAEPGQIIRFHLPFGSGESSNCVVKTLNYDVDGWTRTLQITEMKFQWIRIQKNSDDEENEQMKSIEDKIEQLAYVTQVSERNDLKFIPAQQGLVESSVWSSTTETTIATCTDLAAIQTKSFSEKNRSFRDLCKIIANKGKSQSICIQVRRQFLLEDSLEAVMGLNTAELQSTWRFQFLGEEGVDAGGLKREWFYLISNMLMDPDAGLWKCCGGNQMNLQVNPQSGKQSESNSICIVMFHSTME